MSSDVLDNLDEILESALEDIEEQEKHVPATPSKPTTTPSSSVEVKETTSTSEPVTTSTTNVETTESSSSTTTTTQPTEVLNEVKKLMDSLSRGDFEKTLQELTGSSFPSFNSEEPLSDAELKEITQFMEEFENKPEMNQLMHGVLEKLISKELLYDPMKEMKEKYPEWLESNKSSLSSSEYERYTLQFKYVQEMCSVYENEPENTEKLVDLLQKMQECGQPPLDIVKSLTPDLDLNGQGLPNLPALDQNCTLM